MKFSCRQQTLSPKLSSPTVTPLSALRHLSFGLGGWMEHALIDRVGGSQGNPGPAVDKRAQTCQPCLAGFLDPMHPPTNKAKSQLEPFPLPRIATTDHTQPWAIRFTRNDGALVLFHEQYLYHGLPPTPRTPTVSLPINKPAVVANL